MTTPSADSEDFSLPPIQNSDDEPDLSASESSEEATCKGLSLKDLANASLNDGHFTEAIHLYSTALSHLPDNAIILSNRALAYIKIENYGLAIQDASAAIAADPAYPKGYYRRGSAEFALGRAKAARKDFRAVCRLRPKDRDARNKLAECEKSVREAAFAAAIEGEESKPLSETFRAEAIVVEGGYTGPHPAGYLELGEGESALFEAGSLPREFAMVSERCTYDMVMMCLKSNQPIIYIYVCVCISSNFVRFYRLP
jgi:tetratricopeptide (TPR) repeat protein